MNGRFLITTLCSLCFQANIRIDDQGTARIAGFASAMFPNIVSQGVDDSAGFTVSRWCSPETLRAGSSELTKASDIYAFGMLAYEVGLGFRTVTPSYSNHFQIFSGRVPFHDRQDVAAVMTVITTNERPPRPAHQQLFDQLWEVIERCWQNDPSQRPAIREVVAFLEK